MKHDRHSQYPSRIERLWRSKRARTIAMVAALGLAAAGCSSSSSPSSATPGGGNASPAAAGARTPGTTAPSSSAPSQETSPVANTVPLSAMCETDSAVINTAFQFDGQENLVADCSVPATPSTPGMPVLRWTIGQFSIVIDKVPGYNGQFMKSYEQAKGVQTFTVGGSEGVVVPDAAVIDVGLPDGTVAQMEAQGPAVTPGRTDPALVAAASILLSFNNLNPYSTTLAG